MNNKAQTEAMDRAGELPMERRVAERRSGSQDATIAALNQQLAAARDTALEEAAEACENLVESIGDRSAYDGRELYDTELERMHTAIDCAKAIRALASHPAVTPLEAARERHRNENTVRGGSHPAAPVQPEDYACKRCLGSGDIETGCDEMPVAQCAPCGGTGAVAAPPVQQPGDVRPTWDELFDQCNGLHGVISKFHASLGSMDDPKHDVCCERIKSLVASSALATPQPATLTPAQMWDIASDHLVTRDLDEGPEALIIRTEDELYAVVRAIGGVSGKPSTALTEAQRQNAELVQARLEQIHAASDDADVLRLVDEAMPCINAILAASGGAHAVPEGWPTPTMIDAGGAAMRRGYSGKWREDCKPDEMLCTYIFRHMIAAAPTQDQGEGK